MMVYLVIMLKQQLLLVLVLFLGIGVNSFAQTEAEFEANYAKRIKEEVINGVYIPVDLEDAFNELTRLADPSGLVAFKASPEDSIRRKLHFGFGRWIMNNWGLEEGSRISHYMKLKGVPIPDDMVRVIIVTWHRQLNGRPLNLEDEIALITKRMALEKAKREADRKVIVVDKKPHKE
jgi:hypothetical protein